MKEQFMSSRDQNLELEILSPAQFLGGVNIQMSYLKRSHCLPSYRGATLVSIVSRGQEQKALFCDTHKYMIWISKIPDKFLSCPEASMFLSQHCLQSPKRKVFTKASHTIIPCCERKGRAIHAEYSLCVIKCKDMTGLNNWFFLLTKSLLLWLVLLFERMKNSFARFLTFLMFYVMQWNDLLKFSRVALLCPLLALLSYKWDYMTSLMSTFPVW